MRKVILSMNITLDGFMGGPRGELDWHFNYWNGEMSRYTCEQLAKADTILLGRVTYDAMVSYWPLLTNDLSLPREDIVFAGMMNHYVKIVFSRTLKKTTWYNARIAKGHVGKIIMKLKAQPGKDMMIYGSGSIASAVMRLGLVDELVLWIHPVLLGKGKPLFRKWQDKMALTLINTETFCSGVMVAYYRVDRSYNATEAS